MSPCGGDFGTHHKWEQNRRFKDGFDDPENHQAHELDESEQGAHASEEPEINRQCETPRFRVI